MTINTMKKTALFFILALSIQLNVTAQQANKMLDYVETKDGRKLYGKIKIIDPKSGITFQTYGEGEELKLKHDEIEVIKMAAPVAKDVEEKEPWYLTGLSVVNSVPLFDKTSDDYKDNSIPFNDTNKIKLTTLGIHLNPTFIVKGKHHFGILIGYEKGMNIALVPIGFNIKLGKKIKDKGLLYASAAAGFIYRSQKLGGFTSKINGEYIKQKKSTGDAGRFINIGGGYIYKLNSINTRVFIDLNYRWNFCTISAYTYRHIGAGKYGYGEKYYDVDFGSILIRAGIFF